MAKSRIVENFSLSFSSRDEQSNDTVADISLNFENPKDDATVVTRLNTWLTAIGRTNIIVQEK